MLVVRAPPAASADEARPGREPGPYETRIRALMARMSVDEKLGQLQQFAWTGATGPGGAPKVVVLGRDGGYPLELGIPHPVR
ncbi:hypothetical protein ACWEWX_03090, partial [Streptomyces asiaticus]